MAQLAAAREWLLIFLFWDAAFPGRRCSTGCFLAGQVARYLYWAVDGGLHPGEMDLHMLIKSVTSLACLASCYLLLPACLWGER